MTDAGAVRRVPRRPRAIKIVKDRAGSCRPDVARVDEVLARLPHPEQVEFIQISSTMGRLPRLSLLAHLQYVHIGAPRVRDYDELSALTQIRELSIVNYKGRDLSAFSHLRLAWLRLLRGHVERFDISPQVAFLQSCQRLARFGDVRIESLTLDHCHNVELTSLAKVRRLRHLDILARRSLRSFGFLRSCTTLRDLVVTATPLRNADRSALHHAHQVRTIFLMAQDNVIAELSTKNRRAIVTNGDVCYRAGKEQPDLSLYYDRCGS